MSLSLAVTIAIFVGIAIRQWLPAWLRIWHIMTAGALVLLATGEIGPLEGVKAVDWNVIAYLFGVFSIAEALYRSGIPHRLGDWLTARSGVAALWALLALTAIGAALFTNDAIAVLAVPLALALARSLGHRPAVPLIALSVAITFGSMLTPVGNPQNILIVAKGVLDDPYTQFLVWLGPPAIAALVLTGLWLAIVLRRERAGGAVPSELPHPERPDRLWATYLSTGLLIVLIGTDGVLQAFRPEASLPLGWLALAACVPLYLVSPHRLELLRDVDWGTLVFFVAMFVVTGAVLASGSIEALLGPLNNRLDEPPVIAGIGFTASQLFSNVPLVEIYLGLLKEPSVPALMLLAAASTLASNLFIISAASNVIVVQQTEKFGEEPYTFWQFALICLPITIASSAIAYAWIVWVL